MRHTFQSLKYGNFMHYKIDSIYCKFNGTEMCCQQRRKLNMYFHKIQWFVTVIIPRRVRWAAYIAGTGEMRIDYKILTVRRDYMGDTLISELVLERERECALVCTRSGYVPMTVFVNTLMNLRVLQTQVYLDHRNIYQLFKKLLHHEVSAVITTLFFFKSFFAYTKDIDLRE
jgi:hypothetical protein